MSRAPTEQRLRAPDGDLGRAAGQQDGQLVAAQPAQHGVAGPDLAADQPGEVHERVVADGVPVRGR